MRDFETMRPDVRLAANPVPILRNVHAAPARSFEEKTMKNFAKIVLMAMLVGGSVSGPAFAQSNSGGAMSNGSMSNGAMSGSMSSGAMSDHGKMAANKNHKKKGAMTSGAMSGSMSNGSMSGGSMSNGSMTGSAGH